MTREELKRQVSEAGRHFIGGVDSSPYLKRWFNTQAFVDDVNVERLDDTITYYNNCINKWLESGMTDNNYKDMAYVYYYALEGMLYILRNVNYYKPDKDGDINPFIDYCWSCWFRRDTIDFAEYEKIRAFIED